VSAEALRSRGIGEDNTVTLTVGSRAGVEPKTPVVAPKDSWDGAHGRSVFEHRDLWTHTDFAASAMSADRSAYGIIYPHLSESGRGEDTPPERYLLELRELPFDRRSSQGPRS
jgi:hypothetical protein